MAEDLEKKVNENEEDTIIKLNGFKRAMLEHLMKEKEYAKGTTFMEMDLGHIRELRKTHKASYTSYIVTAVARALKDWPMMNSQFDGEKITLKKHINLGVAVDSNGRLMVPVIKDADTLSVQEIGAKIKEFQDKAAARKMRMDDLADGTFTVTNSGVFGSSFFVPILSHPQSAILGIAGIVDKPVVRDGEIVIRPMCNFCLSFDHRVIEGSVAVQFLAQVRDTLLTFEV